MRVRERVRASLLATTALYRHRTAPLAATGTAAEASERSHAAVRRGRGGTEGTGWACVAGRGALWRNGALSSSLRATSPSFDFSGGIAPIPLSRTVREPSPPTTRTHAHAHAREQTHTRLHARTNAHTHARARTQTHTHTRTDAGAHRCEGSGFTCRDETAEQRDEHWWLELVERAIEHHFRHKKLVTGAYAQYPQYVRDGTGRNGTGGEGRGGAGRGGEGRAGRGGGGRRRAAGG